MKKPVIVVLIVLVFAGGGFYASSVVKEMTVTADKPVPTPSSSPSSEFASCYHGVVAGADSVFTVSIDSAGSWSGKMSFVNKEKDSSYGTYKGSYAGGFLTAQYTFWSEGVQSVGDYVFNRDGENFVGSGYTYKPATDCELFTERKPG